MRWTPEGHTWDLWIKLRNCFSKQKKKKVAEFIITLLRSVDAPTRTQTGSRVGTWDTHTYKSTILTSDTTPYFHNFIHMHGDTDSLSLSLSLFFPSPFKLPTTHILCISSHAPTLSSPLQYSQSHPPLIPVLPTLSKFQILSHSLCV